MFDSPYSFLLFCGLFFNATGFLIRDELLLRLLVVCGTCFQIAFYALQNPPIFESVLTNMVLIAINLVLITIIVLERSTLFMTQPEKDAFEQFKTLTPGQFRRINRRAEWLTAEADTEVLKEGEPSGMLYFLDTPEFGIIKEGQNYKATGPAFAGEIMLLLGGTASATVIVPKGAVYACWPVASLRKAMRSSQSLENALVARFSHDLADKVRRSVPLNNSVRRA